MITGIQVTEDTEESDSPTFMSGTPGYVLGIDGNPFVQAGQGQTVANYLGAKIVGLRFRPLSVSALSDPSIEAGDVAIVSDRKGNSYRCHLSNLSFTVGQMENFSCDAATPSRKSAASYSAVTKAIVEMRNRVKVETTAREQAIADLTNTLANSSGLFSTDVTQPDGSKIRYAHDKKTLAESTIVWKFTAEAWAVSTDGGKTYPTGFTMNGDMVARMLSVVGLDADWIKAGNLKALNGKTEINMNTGVAKLTGSLTTASSDGVYTADTSGGGIWVKKDGQNVGWLAGMNHPTDGYITWLKTQRIDATSIDVKSMWIPKTDGKTYQFLQSSDDAVTLRNVGSIGGASGGMDVYDVKKMYLKAGNGGEVKWKQVRLADGGTAQALCLV
ncbi:hypothetical protein [Scatolibacter rhodanostii]|uniref:hypothetical protein n=1 Tax=Scatolibacter rhodanostii TaxID=2014781 RepID=UPI000C075E94|nr:hypothetical protein [Scatolibacter rhodanostii]